MKSELKNRFKEIYGGFIVDIMSCTKLTPLQRIVLNYLCINQDDFSPSYGVIAKYCGIKKRQTAMETIKFFESHNLLCVERQNKGMRNIIHIHYDALIVYLHSPKVTSKASRPAKLTSPSKVPAKLTGTLQGPEVVPYRDQGGTLQGPVLLDSKNRKEIDKEMDKAPPTPPTLKLDVQTPKDLEKKPAKKKVKSKARRKPRITTWEAGNPYSEIFTLLCSLEPYKDVFDLPRDTKTISGHMATQNWNIDQMTYIVRLFVTKSTGTEDEIKSPRKKLATYVGNGEKWNGPELEKLKPFQGDYI
jgi:hypothetical protein